MVFNGVPAQCVTDSCLVNRVWKNCPTGVYKPRTFLQFNDLVFDGAVTEEQNQTAWKTSSHAIIGGHGEVSTSIRNGEMKLNKSSVSLTVALPFYRLTDYQVANYATYIKANFAVPGKLWAVDSGGKLVWAYAEPSQFSENYDAPFGTLSYSVEFDLPDGYWHIADLTKVYLAPYDRCDFVDQLCDVAHVCLGDFIELQTCKWQDPDSEPEVCQACQKEASVFCDEFRYCNTEWNPYDECQSEYKIVYSCASGDSMFNNHQFHFTERSCRGSVICKFEADSIIQGVATVTIYGKMHNPTINFNNAHVKIKGDYEGYLSVESNGNVFNFGDLNGIYPCWNKRVPLENISYSAHSLELPVINGDNVVTVSGLAPSSQADVFIDLDERTY